MFIWGICNFLVHIFLLYFIHLVYRLNHDKGMIFLILYFGFIFAYIPYANWIPDGELQHAYLKLIDQQLIPKYGYDKEQEVEPLLFIHWLTLKSFYHFFINDIQASILLRFFAYIYVLYVSYKITLLFQAKYSLNYSYYIIATIILLATDWHIGLLIGDQFRNLFGMIFFYYVVYYVIKNNWNLVWSTLALSSILAILIHKSFILLIPMIFIFARYHNFLYKNFKIQYIIILALPVILISKEALNTISLLTNVLSFDKINHILINIGFDELLHPGMLAQGLTSLAVLWLIFYNRKSINNDKFLHTIALLVVFLYELFFIPLLGIQFVEYERIFYSLAPFVIPFLVFLIFKTFTKKSAFLILFLYSIYNILVYSTFIDLLGIYTYSYYNNIQALFSSTFIIITVLLFLILLLSFLVRLKTLFLAYSVFLVLNYLGFLFIFNSFNGQHLFLELLFFCASLTFFIHPLLRFKIAK